MTVQAGLRLTAVAYRADHKLLLQGITVDVHAGACLGILGPNGAGKSTLLRLLAGVLPPSAGQVLLDGQALQCWPARARARRLALVPQRTELTFPLRAREVVLLGRTPYVGRWQQESREDVRVAEEAMALTDTTHLAEQAVTTLSGGELQRVVIARALAQQPAFLLLDEPTASLDLRHQLEISSLLSTLRRRGVTIVLATHDLNLALALCSTVLLLQQGRIVAVGPPAAVLTPQRVRAVFAVDVCLAHHPVTGMPYLIPVPLRADDGFPSFTLPDEEDHYGTRDDSSEP
ncbi:MAG: ABC transporter ATP-binding protein [Candidatus Binatia bacterium]|nr:ABC transporter ATP-binding protein [Candidatus Binatia bacterium]